MDGYLANTPCNGIRDKLNIHLYKLEVILFLKHHRSLGFFTHNDINLQILSMSFLSSPDERLFAISWLKSTVCLSSGNFSHFITCILHWCHCDFWVDTLQECLNDMRNVLYKHSSFLDLQKNWQPWGILVWLIKTLKFFSSDTYVLNY